MGFAEKEQARAKRKSVVGAIAGVETEEQIEGQIDIETLEDGKYMPPQKEAKSNEVVKLPQKEEARSKRVNLLLKPSVHKMAQTKCKEIGISLNECINQLLENWIEN
jgi:hypothetical protein